MLSLLAPGAARAAAPVAVVHRQLFELPHAVAGHQRRLAMHFSDLLATCADEVRTSTRDDHAEVSVQGSSGSCTMFASDGLIDTSVALHGRRLDGRHTLIIYQWLHRGALPGSWAGLQADAGQQSGRRKGCPQAGKHGQEIQI